MSGQDEPATVVITHPSAELYGSDRVMLETVEAMVAQDWRVVVALPAAGPLTDEVVRRGAMVLTCPMPVLRKSAMSPAGFARLIRDAAQSLAPSVRMLRRFGRPVLYVSTLTTPLWLLIGRVLGLRVICHVHEAEGAQASLVRQLIAAPLLAAHAVVVNSGYSSEVMRGAIPRLASRSTVVYNGVPGPVEVTPPRATLTTPVRLLFVGRLSERKGAQVAVAGLAELRRRGVEARLELLGSVYPGYEWFEDRLRADVTAAGLAEHVEFLGFRPEVWPSLAAADIVLVPSVRDEPFGNTAVEALLAARPLVVSSTSGLREAAGGYLTPRFVPPDDPIALADAVVGMTEDWSQQRDGAVTDAEQARRRHEPPRYRAAIARSILGVGSEPGLRARHRTTGGRTRGDGTPERR